MKPYFPPLDTSVYGTLRTIKRMAAADPEFFKSPECPYPPDVIALFTGPSLASVTAGIPGGNIEVPLEDYEVEATKLLMWVKGLKPSGDVAKDGIDYAKAVTSLLEKLLSIKERAMKLKDVESFQALVLEFMQDILTPAQRTLFMDKIANG